MTPSDSAAPALQVEGLRVAFGALKALDDVSWQVRPGEILGIIGPNGAGKSTCYNAATHLVRREGRVTLIVTSDHGGSGLRHGSESPADVRIPWLAWGAEVPAGGWIPRVRTVDTAATVLSLLGLPVPADWLGKSHHPFYVEPGAADVPGGGS